MAITEEFLSDHPYPIGTVVKIGGKFEVTIASFGELAIGVVSEVKAKTVTVVLKGKAKILSNGVFSKGARLVADNSGTAAVVANNMHNVFAIALESKQNQDIQLIDCIVK